MTASIEISQSYDLQAIAQAAGMTDEFGARYADGLLYVEGVTQEALESAAAAHDPLPGLRQGKLTMLNSAYEAEFAAIKAQYPDAERESWPIQLAEAESLAADPAALTPFLDALLVARGFGETKAELAAKVQEKNQAYSAMSATLTGKRHALERQIYTATTVEQLQAITW